MTSDPEHPVTVHIRHVRAANLCARGARAWFERYGLSWSSFLSVGCDANRLIETGDPLAMRAVVEAMKESNDGRK